MRKVLSLPAAFGPIHLGWPLLAGELGLLCLLISTEGFSPLLLRALRLFLRF